MNVKSNQESAHLQNSTSQGSGPISGAVLKWIAILTMLIDHIGASVYWQYIASKHYASELIPHYQLLRYIGRISFPIFIYLLVEGFRYTKNKTKYLIQMFCFGIVSEIPFDLAFHRKFFYWDSQNVYFTLFLGLLVIFFLDKIDKRWPMNLGTTLAIKTYLKVIVILAGCALAYFAKTDYDLSGVAAIVVMYCVRNIRFSSGHQNRQLTDAIAFTATCLVLLTSSFSEAYGLIGIPFICLYNGTRGRQMKYFFYFFYPVHLLLLWILMKFMGLA